MLTENPLNKIFLLFGQTACGKGAYTKTIRHLVGSTNTIVSRYLHAAKEHGGVANWMGKSVVVLDEAETAKKEDHARICTLLKTCTGGDEVEVRDIYKGERWGVVGAKIWVLSNTPIEYEDAGGAFSRRLVPLYFDHVAPPEKRDSLLPWKILAEEGAVIATMSSVWLRNHWHLGESMFEYIGGQSKAMRSASIRLEKSTNILKSVVRRALVLDEMKQEVLPSGLLIYLLEKLCAVEGMEISRDKIRTNYGPEMESIFPKIKYETKKVDQKIFRVWTGVKLDKKSIENEFEIDFAEVLRNYMSESPASKKLVYRILNKYRMQELRA